MNLSYWEQSIFTENIDVIIIGSGIVGLNAAITLKEKAPKLKVVIVERGTFPAGASTKNAGFACFGSVSELLDDLEEQSEEQVWNTLLKRWEGLQRLQQRVGANNMDFYQYGNYELFRQEDTELLEKCHSALPKLNKILKQLIGVSDTFQILDAKSQNFGMNGVKSWIWNQAEGQINTGKMMQQLLKIAHLKGIEIWNGITIDSIEEQTNQVLLQTKNGWQIKAKKLLVATNGFAQHLLPHIKVKPARNQVLITKPISNLNVKGCFHYQQGYVYFRNINDRILLGGARHLDKKGETTSEFGFSETIQDYLTNFLKTTIIPDQDVSIDYWWSGIMGVGSQKTPLIKAINDKVVVAVRMGGMGVAIGTLVGEEGAALLLEKF
jgi:glycine/D-amino acid oxidase-like deaminating enzyme